MARYLLFFLVLLTGPWLVAQTSLAGKVVDGDGEPVIFGNVAIYKGGNLISGTQTDFDGNYSIPSLDPGTYDVETSYVGLQTQRVNGVIVYGGKTNKLDFTMTAGGVNLEEIVVVDYKVPLIEQDNTTQGKTLTSEDIKNLPTRNINALAATAAGLASADEGDDINVRGARDNATNYYIDGIRVQGNLIQESEIDQLQVITGGMEAQYGDVTGGIISITTKGPSSKFSGGLEMETSEFLDPYRQSLIGFNLSGPILKKKDSNESILGFRVAGRYSYQYDDDPNAIDVYRIKDDKLAELEANPVILVGGNPIVAADFITNDDVDALDAQPFEERTVYNVTAKLDARLSKAVDITFSGSLDRREGLFTPNENTNTAAFYNWRVFNSHNNPFQNTTDYRGSFRFRHRLGAATNTQGDESKKKGASIQNALYTLQFSYEKNLLDREDSRHFDNYFDYGHVGIFDIEWIPSFERDPQTFGLSHTDYRRVLRGYQPGTANPVLANYNNPLAINASEGLNSQIGSEIIFFQNIPNVSPNISREQFFAPNGTISSTFSNSWGLHQNVGWVYDLARKNDDDIYIFNATSSFELVPGNSDKGRHSIQFGILYEQRTTRRYDINPRDLWDVARQQANNHILGIPENPDSLGLHTLVTGETSAIFDVAISNPEDSRFFREVRNVTGQSLKDFVNVDGLSPDQLSLDMFSAKELNDQDILDYWGYDYLGNNFDGTFDDFFTATDENGIRTFPVAPNRPIYTAAYIQDKFQFKDIIFRVGVRVDRYDANTKVLKDNYSIYDIQRANNFHTNNPEFGEQPANIGNDYRVYLNESGSSVQGYRDGDQWYFGNGTPANSPTLIFPGGLVNPAYVDERANSIGNYIKSKDFDPNASFEDYEPQINWMPRLAFSFPISTEANFFAHYDVLVQRPASNTIASALDYFYFTDDALFKDNPNLLPEKTIDYEVGFQQKLSNTSAIKLAAYYKEMRDMIQRRTFFPVPIINRYNTYDNLDFGTVKGFSFNYDMRRTGNILLNANYTLQFADGTGSDSDSQRGLTNRGNLRNLFPLSFDERHRIVGTVDYRYGSGDRYNGPELFGSDIFASAGVNLQIVAVSGRPYTAKEVPDVLGGDNTLGAVNGARLPWNYTVNLRVDKNFQISNRLNCNVYVRVSNLLDRRNIIQVYSASGSAFDDGYLDSFRGTNAKAAVGALRSVEAFVDSYQWRVANPNFLSLPRRIFIGASFGFN